MAAIHNVFHVSMLKKHIPNPDKVIEPQAVQIQEDLSYESKPIQILERDVKRLRNKEVPLVKGKEPLISTTGLHQLHILILAVLHVVNSALIMILGRAKIHRWKDWEKDTTSAEYAFANGAHLAPGTNFNFKRYIKRDLEDDFKQVVAISSILWASAVIILLLNVHGWQELFWALIIPLVIILAVGMKLQAIMAGMAVEIKDRQTVVQGIPLVHLTDQHFWFGRPQFILFLIRLALFLNGFQITYFFWTWYEFGLGSCFHEAFHFIIARIVIGVIGQVLCGYITLPLYALVSEYCTWNIIRERIQQTNFEISSDGITHEEIHIQLCQEQMIHAPAAAAAAGEEDAPIAADDPAAPEGVAAPEDLFQFLIQLQDPLRIASHAWSSALRTYMESSCLSDKTFV
ncbi:MLO-like protein 10 [Curcuma longa]|uniref:MLO-like protein 10 n=1 Tax=Curcuma longa TaxID=136217 RepID=UPI003D9EE4EE